MLRILLLVFAAALPVGCRPASGGPGSTRETTVAPTTETDSQTTKTNEAKQQAKLEKKEKPPLLERMLPLLALSDSASKNDNHALAKDQHAEVVQMLRDAKESNEELKVEMVYEGTFFSKKRMQLHHKLVLGNNRRTRLNSYLTPESQERIALEIYRTAKKGDRFEVTGRVENWQLLGGRVVVIIINGTACKAYP